MNNRKNRFPVHRLVWAFVNGKWPNDQIDHVNGIKNDNRLINLREANNSQNNMNKGKQSNNTSGFKGVSWHKLRNKWRSDIRVDGKRFNLGNYDCIAAASFAYQIASDKYHGEFGREV